MYKPRPSMEELHDGGDREHPPLLPAHTSRQDRRRSNKRVVLCRPFAWMHTQEPGESAFLGELNRSMRSGDRRVAPAAASGGVAERSRASPESGRPFSKPAPIRLRVKAAAPLQLVRVSLERIEEEREEKIHAAERKLRIPIRAPARAEVADERKLAVEACPPQEPVPSMAKKVHVGHQEPGPSSSHRSSSGKNPVRPSHHRREPGPVRLRPSNREEEAYQVGKKAYMSLDPAARDSEVNTFYGIEDQPRSQRIAEMQRREADLPSFKFQLPDDRAQADVDKVFHPPKLSRKGY